MANQSAPQTTLRQRVGLLLIIFLLELVSWSASAAALQVGAVFSTAQSSSQSFLRFHNTGTNPGAATVTLRDYTTGQVVGSWTSPQIPAGAEQQYSIATVESGIGGSSAKPAYYSIAVDAAFTGYFQHVLWRSADGTLTNLSTCSAGITASRAQLSGVHSSLLGADYPSSVVVNNTGAAAQTVRLGIYDARDGAMRGAYTTGTIGAGGETVISVAAIEAAAGVPPAGMYHYVVKAEGAFSGYLQHLVNNVKAGVTTDMTTACALDGAVSATAAGSSLLTGTVFSSVQAASQSFLRFYNAGATSGTVTVNLRDYATGQTLGQWTSPALAAGSEQQFAISTIEAGTYQAFTKPAYYAITVQSNIDGRFQHVLWRSTDGTLTNLSTCVAGTGAEAASLSGVHSSLLSQGYESTVVVVNTGTGAQAPRLGIYDARNGTKMGVYNAASVPPGGQAVLTVGAIEAGARITPSSGMAHWVVKLEDPFTGFLQHLVNNAKAGVITDMTTTCKISKVASKVFDIQSVNFYDFPHFANHQGAPDSYDLALTKELFADFRRMGANTVTLGWGVPVDENTGRLAAAFTQADRFHAPSLDEIRALSQVAHQVGLDVMLKPQANSAGPIDGVGFPTNINGGQTPKVNPTTFLTEWAGYMNTVAALAQETNAVMVVVGTENGGFEGTAYRSLWANVISSVRAKYTGPLTYHANTDPSLVAFWDLVDVIGIDAYYPLTPRENPTYADALAGWTNNTILPKYLSPNGTAAPVNIVADLKALSDRYGKPVYFGEIGMQSMRGALSFDPTKGTLNGVTDQQEQAYFFQSMFEALSTANTGWFKGINIWMTGSGSVAKSADGWPAVFAAAATGPNSYEVRGKSAEKVISAWFGAVDYLSPDDVNVAGSIANDRIALYGDAATPVSGQALAQPSTFRTVASFSVAGPILNNDGFTLHAYLNGVDLGLQKVAGSHFPVIGVVDSLGVPWTTRQTLTVSLPGLVPITSFKLAMDNPILTGIEPSASFLQAANINGVALTSVAYTPRTGGSPIPQTMGTAAMVGGGSQTIDAAPWNTALNARQIGTVAQPIQVTGGGGSDTVYVLGTRADYTIAGIGSSTLTLRENAGLGQNAVLNNIARVQFQDGQVLNTLTGAVN